MKKRRPRAAQKKKAKSAKWSKADEASYQDFLANSGIRELGKRLKEIEAEVEAAGLPPHFRDPLSCGKCGLFEGELANGLLYTAKYRNSRTDSGLRFTKIKEGVFHCPSCGARVKEPKWEPPAD